MPLLDALDDESRVLMAQHSPPGAPLCWWLGIGTQAARAVAEIAPDEAMPLDVDINNEHWKKQTLNGVEEVDCHPDAMSLLMGDLPLGVTELHIDFSFLHVGLEGARQIAWGLSRATGCRRLHIDGSMSRIRQKGIIEICQTLPRSVTSLTLLLEGEKLEEKGLQAIARFLPPRLEELHLGLAECNVSSAGGVLLAKQLPTTLRRLNLNFHDAHVGTRIGSEGAVALLGAIEALDLEALALDFATCPISRAGASAIAEALPKLEHLRSFEFNLSRTGISEKGVQMVVKKLPSSLHNLSLMADSEQLSDSSARLFASVMPPALVSLQLGASQGRISDAGISVIAEALPSSLVDLRLHLERNNFGDAGVQTLAAALPPNLRRAVFDFTYVSDLTVVGPMSLVDAARRLSSLKHFELTVCHCNLILDDEQDALHAAGRALPESIDTRQVIARLDQYQGR